MTEQENTPAAPESAGDAPAPVEAAAPIETPAPTPAPTPSARPTGSQGGFWWGTGRRKASVARVRIRPGTGQLTINKRPYEEFFTGERDRKDLLNVLERTNTTKSVDVHVNVLGGGCSGQAGAIVLGLARALNRYDPSLEPILRDNHFLTRDPRRVERKKYGQRGARARFQFSKR